MSLSNHDIIKIARASNIPMDAVLNKDQLEQIPNEWSQRSFSLVINLMDLLDPTTGEQLPGSHWVGLYHKPGEGFAYFDSYGFIYPVEVENLCNRLSASNILWSEKMIQRVNSTICGYYTLYFLYAMSKPGSLKKKFKAFQSDFGDPVENTKRLDKLLKRHFK